MIECVPTTAHSEAGDFDASIKWQKQALELFEDEDSQKQARVLIQSF